MRCAYYTVVEPLARFLHGATGERHVLDLLAELVDALQVEVHELLDRRVLLEGLRAQVDEQRSRERVLARSGALHAGLDALDGESLELVPILLEVAEAEVSQGVRVTGDALHQHVVVLAGLVVCTARAPLADNFLGEVVEGARLARGFGSHPRKRHFRFVLHGLEGASHEAIALA